MYCVQGGKFDSDIMQVKGRTKEALVSKETVGLHPLTL